MKSHRGMRRHDIVVLLKISTFQDTNWLIKDTAFDLGISQSEVSESLNRSRIAGLLAADKKTVMKSNLFDFLEHGLRYVFPAEPGALQRGMATAHSAPPLNQFFPSEEVFVWPWANGQQRGQAVEPLHPGVPNACNKDFELYELLTCVDTIRLGRVREKEMAIKELQKRLILI